MLAKVDDDASNQTQNFSAAENEIFSKAREAQQGLRRTFELWCCIGYACQVARKHADALGGNRKVRGALFRDILSSQKLERFVTGSTRCEASLILKVMSRLDDVKLWRATLSDLERVRWASPQSVINRAPCFRPDGKIRGAVVRAKPMSLNEWLRMPSAQSAQLLLDRNSSKAFAIFRALQDLIDSGTPRPASGWELARAAARERESVSAL